MTKFPLSHGKIPGMEGPDLRLTETIAIVTVSRGRENCPVKRATKLFLFIL
jgi:hypothetical protein